MPKRRLKLRELKKIMRRYGIGHENKKRGKGSHILFKGTIDGSNYSYPVPNQADVLPCYVKGIRKKFELLPEHGITDEQFFDD